MHRGRSLSNLAALFVAAGLLLGLPVQAQRGGLAAPQTLVDLVDRAGVIVQGQVVLAHVEPHPDFPSLTSVVVTLRVKETLKGQAGDTFTFRQYVWDLRDRYSAAGYQKGSEVVLFLTPPSDVGLSSPVGLGQGRFRIVRDEKGNEYLMNETGNRGLFRNVRSALQTRGVAITDEQRDWIEGQRGGPVAFQALRELVRQIAEKN